MKQFIVFLSAFFLLASCVSKNPAVTDQGEKSDGEIKAVNSGLTDISEFELVWSDEFDYEGVPDQAKWKYETGGFGWWNNELQFYTKARKENARVEDGRLIIEACKEEYKSGAKINHYTSARLFTKYKGEWCYGRIEVRAKLPRGRGVWPAIWMMPTGDKYGGWPSSGEIDIMEHVGFEPGVIHSSVHTYNYNHRKNTQKSNQLRLDSPDENFYTYGIEWREDAILFFVDDKEVFVFPKLEDDFRSWPFNQKFHLILNIAVGGDWGGLHGIDDTIFPQRMEVEYVRVYQKKQVSR